MNNKLEILYFKSSNEIPDDLLSLKAEELYDTYIGYRRDNLELKVTCQNNEHFSNYIFYEKDKIYLRKGVIPSMFTLNVRNILDDCICYLMVPA